MNSGAREMAAIADTALLQALLLTGQTSAALELLKGLNYCDVKICEEILQKKNHYSALLELDKSNAMHREALKLLHQLVEESKSNQSRAELTQKFNPESIIEYLKLHVPELALAYCDRVYESMVHQPFAKYFGNIYLTLLQIYLNPRRTTKNFEKRITNLVSSQNISTPKAGSGTAVKAEGGHTIKKIASIEGAEDMRTSPSGSDSGRSDGDAEEFSEGYPTIMLDQVLDLLSQRWDKNQWSSGSQDLAKRN